MNTEKGNTNPITLSTLVQELGTDVELGGTDLKRHGSSLSSETRTAEPGLEHVVTNLNIKHTLDEFATQPIASRGNVEFVWDDFARRWRLGLFGVCIPLDLIFFLAMETITIMVVFLFLDLFLILMIRGGVCFSLCCNPSFLMRTAFFLSILKMCIQCIWLLILTIERKAGSENDDQFTAFLVVLIVCKYSIISHQLHLNISHHFNRHCI